MSSKCASAQETDAAGYELITKESNRPSSTRMMGKSRLSAITLMTCIDVTEACKTAGATAWATALTEHDLTTTEHTKCDTEYLNIPSDHHGHHHHNHGDQHPQWT